jgi:glycosyltransferase involved in cell wall biosynthesis
MRILNVIMCLDPVGGGGSVERINQLSKHLSLMGEDCTILTTRQGWNEEHVLKLGNVKIVALPYLTERFKIPLGLFGWLNKHLLDYDVVHLTMNWTMITAVTYLYLRYFKRPYVYSAMGLINPPAVRSKLIKHVYQILFTKSIIRHAKTCIAITKREVNDYESLGVDRTKISLIPNGITTEAFLVDHTNEAFRSRYHIDSRPFILFIGRLDPIKGPDLLIKAFAAISDDFSSYQLVIAGNNYGFLDELKPLTQLYKINNKVTFLGPVFGMEKKSLYRSADLFVIPSRFDTMTIVALEAAASGTPVLLTKQCDFDELQEAGGGLAVEASVEGLEYGLRKLLSNPEELKQMGIHGKEFVLKKYHWDYVCKQFMEIFQKYI